MTIPKLECCQKTLEILLGNVKSIEDLDLIETTIADYQKEFNVDLTKYWEEVKVMRNQYLFRPRR